MKYISYVVTAIAYLFGNKLMARLLVNVKLANWYAKSPGVSSGLLMELYRLITNTSTETMEKDTISLLVCILVNEKVPSIMTDDLWKIVTSAPTGAFTGFCCNRGLDKLNPMYEAALFKKLGSLTASHLNDVVEVLRANPAVASMHPLFTLAIMVLKEDEIDPDFLAALMANYDDDDSNGKR